MNILLWLLLVFPPEFTVTERFFTLWPTFDVACAEAPLATATSRFFSLSASYDLVGTDAQPMAHGQARFFAWGTVVDLFTPEKRILGTLEETVIRFIQWAEYRLYDEEQKPLAHIRMNFLGTAFEVRDATDSTRIYATLRRPLFRFFHDAWSVQILEEAIDPRILVFLAVFQTDKDNRDRYRRDIERELRREQDDYEGRRLG